jgi:serine/threonine-protein kinase HipA
MEAHKFFVGWNQLKVAEITFDGIVWKFDTEDGWMLRLSEFEQIKPSKIPPFLTRLMPEGFSQDALNQGFMEGEDQRLRTLQSSERYMSNIVITQDSEKIKQIPLDRLSGRVESFIDDHVFTGNVSRVPKFSGRHLDELKELVARDTMSRISGFGAKIPMHLSDDGELYPAEYSAFTHILKLPGLNGDKDNMRCALEWAGLEMAKAGGINVSRFSMVALEEGGIGLLSERFDIPRNEEDLRKVFREDFCSITGVASTSKYRTTSEKIGMLIREISTSPDEDCEEFLSLVCANLFLENGDFHMKNISMIKVAEPALNKFRSIRLSPAYDIHNTKFFGNYPSPIDQVAESMALSINDKECNIRMPDLDALAKVIGIASDQAELIARRVAEGILARAAELSAGPPKLIASQPIAISYFMQACLRVVDRIVEVFPDMQPKYDDVSLLIKSTGKKPRPA